MSLPMPWHFDRLHWEKQGFMGFLPAAELRMNPDLVTDSPGVYVVLREDLSPPKFTHSGSDLDFVADELRRRWTDRSPTLYIGRATSLRTRVTQLVRQREHQVNGRRGSHRGGRALWQVTGCEHFLVAWVRASDFKEREAELLIQFREAIGQPPFANRQG